MPTPALEIPVVLPPFDAPAPDRATVARLYGEKVTAESSFRAQARWVGMVKREAQEAHRAMLAALEQYGSSGLGTPNAKLLSALENQEASFAALSEAHTECMASLHAMYQAQSIYMQALLKAPLAARAAHLDNPHTTATAGWPTDAELEALRDAPDEAL